MSYDDREPPIISDEQSVIAITLQILSKRERSTVNVAL